MKSVTPARLFEALDATWPAARQTRNGPWLVRQGFGGGKRVSAITALGPVSAEDLPKAEEAAADFGQTPLFMVQGDDAALDTVLQKQGYDVVDPVVLYVAETAAIAKDLSLTAAIPSWPPLAVQREIWAQGGIGPERVAVMDRCGLAKTTFLGRTGDDPAGTAFVAQHDNVAMIHAIEVFHGLRRRGVAVNLVQACAKWAAQNGARWVGLAVTRANFAANALYQSLGMVEATHYHYRQPGAVRS
ncbi:MAG: GNAT family N-acetyltransferase [Paracoccaceae bacterium]